MRERTGTARQGERDAEQVGRIERDVEDEDGENDRQDLLDVGW